MDESHENFPDEGKGFFFRQFLTLFEKMFEISFIAELSDDVAIVGSTENIMAFHDVGMVQLLEGFNLPL